MRRAASRDQQRYRELQATRVLLVAPSLEASERRFRLGACIGHGGHRTFDQPDFYPIRGRSWCGGGSSGDGLADAFERRIGGCAHFAESRYVIFNGSIN